MFCVVCIHDRISDEVYVLFFHYWLTPIILSRCLNRGIFISANFSFAQINSEIIFLLHNVNISLVAKMYCIGNLRENKFRHSVIRVSINIQCKHDFHIEYKFRWIYTVALQLKTFMFYENNLKSLFNSFLVQYWNPHNEPILSPMMEMNLNLVHVYLEYYVKT